MSAKANLLLLASVWLAACGGGAGSGSAPGAVETTAYASYEESDEALRQRFAGGVRLGGRDVPVTRGAAPGYVPDETCARCHPDLVESYAETGMARAFQAADPDAVVEDFEDAHYYHEASGRHYEMQLVDGRYRMARYQEDEEGRYNEFSCTIDSVVGSAHKSRVYFYRMPNDELYQAPLAWYTEDGAWKMPPGYERADHSGFLRQATRDCMFCHNGYPEVPVGSDRLGEPHRFPKEMPQGLGCQRCHGPGAEHVAVANDPAATLEAIQRSIFNSGRLEGERRTDVCMQCHLQPDSATLSIVRRLGRGDYSYRPDQPLNDYIVHVDHDADPDRFQINHHPFRLFQSTCYTASEGALGCLTCHDPHVKVGEEERASHYRKACLSCHRLEQCDTAHMQAKDAPEAVDCTGCHMPQSRTMDVIETIMTDHRIRREPPATDLTVWKPRPPHVDPGERSLLSSHANPAYTGDAGLSPEDCKVLSDISGAGKKDRDAIEALSASIESGEVRDLEALLYLAIAYWNVGEVAGSVRTYRRILEVRPDLAMAHRMIGRGLLKAGRTEQALASLERARELDPLDPETHFGLGLAYSRSARSAPAMEAFREALRLRPIHVDAQLNVAHLLANQGKYAEAAEAYATVHRLDPGREEGYFFRGLMSHLDRDPAAARLSWTRGLRACAGSGPLAGAEAFALVQAGAHAEALEAAKRAREAGADEGVCLLVQALAEAGLGRQVAAITTLERAQAAPGTTGIEATLRAILEREARVRVGA